MSRMPINHIDWTKFSSMVSRAISDGAELNSPKCEWDASGGCEKPYMVSFASAPPEHTFLEKVQIKDGYVFYLDMWTPCRKCPKCLDNRRRLWSARMRREYINSNRSWLMTFTINPHYRFIFSCRSGSRDYFASYSEISKELTKYFKRLRKAGYRFRYCVVAEAHKDGYPHLHALLHEVSAPIPKSRLQAEWIYGFTNCKLVSDEVACKYVSKYLSKDARTRIRASQGYGQSGRDLSTEFIALAHKHAESML